MAFNGCWIHQIHSPLKVRTGLACCLKAERIASHLKDHGGPSL